MNFARKYEGGLDLIWDLNNIVGKGRGVEVGVFRGFLSKEILRLWKDCDLFMVDVWRKLEGEYDDVCNNDEHMQYLKDTCDNIRGYEDRATIIRTTSEVASTLFPDESLDFVYIDANHEYEHVKKDIELWYPKVRKGGVLAGHDYINIDWYDKTVSSKTKVVNGFEITINWTEHTTPKNKNLYKTQEGQTYFNGVFGVNPAVDEFCEKYGYTLDVTKEIWGSWWIIK